MATEISLFDFFPPREAVSGEAFQLSPLDALVFTPVSQGVKVGEKVTTSIFSQISRLFAPKTTIPLTEGVITVTGSGLRGGFGAPFRSAGSVLGERSSTFGINPISQTVVKQTNPFFPKISSPFVGKLNSNIAGLGVISGGILGTSLVLTQTKEGQDLTEGVGNFTTQITDFAQKNPLIIAGVVGIMLIGVLK